jgi:cytochrome c oxidase subunit II
MLVVGLAPAGCSGVQSSLAPAGGPADFIAALYWWMAVGALVVWAAVIALGWYYGRPHPESPSPRRDWWLIVGAGTIFPVIVLTILLAYGLAGIPRITARAPEGSLLIRVQGERWWWRVEYVTAGGAIETANEIRLPVDEPVQFELTSDNVIHSFWIPALGGKMDMIPGRTTALALHPRTTGVFAGACAEYCGTAHAFMRFGVEVMDRPAFEAWLASQAEDAVEPQTPAISRGRDLLLSSGCGACHSVRGTAARGRVAPDLTHVGGRMTIGAATLPATPESLRGWIADAHRAKPGVLMPPFAPLGDEVVDTIARYLSELR